MSGVLDHLAALADPAIYPDRPRAVTIVQTHISVVCLTDTRAYKLKKAVHLPFLDTRTLARRLHDCREEVRLNRRLCPDVYLGVESLVATPEGLRFVPETEVGLIEPAVVMRRLPQERMLDQMLARHEVEAPAIRALAAQVAAFHARCERSATITATGAPRRLAELAYANFAECAALRGAELPAGLLTALEAVTRADFARILDRLEARARTGHVVDGHGDLHTRNVCMTEPPAIYDCIEFEPAFRCGDVATEIAFLLMDLRYRGAPELATAFLDEYVRCTEDTGLRDLVPALVRYRALVRAKVAAITSLEPELPEADRRGAHGSALRHLRLAAASALEEGPRTWWIVCGPPASGKSTLCQALADATLWPVVATDLVRKELLGIAPTTRAPQSAYTREHSERTYAEVLRRAAAEKAAVVVLDGNFATPELRARAVAAAQQNGARARILACSVAPEEARRRVAQRAADPTAISDAGPAELAALQARYVVPQDSEGELVRVPEAPGRDAVVDVVLAAALRSRVP